MTTATLRDAARYCRATITDPNHPETGALSYELGSLAVPLADLLDAIAGLDRLGASVMRSRDHAIRAGDALATAILDIVNEATEASR